jgi:hypothetical protein
MGAYAAFGKPRVGLQKDAANTGVMTEWVLPIVFIVVGLGLALAQATKFNTYTLEMGEAMKMAGMRLVISLALMIVAGALCIQVGEIAFGAFFLAYDASGVIVNPSGNIDVALVDVASTVRVGGIASKVVVRTTPIDSAVVAGAGLQYDVSGSRLVTLRINAEALAGTVAYVEIYTNALV